MTLLAPRFFVAGVPQPKGSGSRKLIPAHCPLCKGAIPLRFGIGRLGPYVESADCRTKAEPSGRLKRWSALVAEAAQRAARYVAEKNDPVELELTFYLERPAGVPERKRLHPTTKPDGDKLARAVQDAIADGVVFDQDGQVTDLIVRKRYARDGQPPGVEVQARLVNPGEECRYGASSKEADSSETEEAEGKEASPEEAGGRQEPQTHDAGWGLW